MTTTVSLNIAPRPIVIRAGVASLRTEPSLPRPHDPDDRVLLAMLAGWELRDFAADSDFARFFARHGLAHRQLLARAEGVSILTPSTLTNGEFECCDRDGSRLRERSETTLRAVVLARYGASLPEGVHLRSLARWALRSPNADAPR
jgi:hypothetical protein